MKSSIQKSSIEKALGYDVSLIIGDLKRTIIVSLFLIGVLLFLAWYLPIGIL